MRFNRVVFLLTIAFLLLLGCSNSSTSNDSAYKTDDISFKIVYSDDNMNSVEQNEILSDVYYRLYVYSFSSELLQSKICFEIDGLLDYNLYPQSLHNNSYHSSEILYFLKASSGNSAFDIKLIYYDVEIRNTYSLIKNDISSKQVNRSICNESIDNIYVFNNIDGYNSFATSIANITQYYPVNSSLFISHNLALMMVTDSLSTIETLFVSAFIKNSELIFQFEMIDKNADPSFALGTTYLYYILIDKVDYISIKQSVIWRMCLE